MLKTNKKIENNTLISAARLGLQPRISRRQSTLTHPMSIDCEPDPDKEKSSPLSFQFLFFAFRESPVSHQFFGEKCGFQFQLVSGGALPILPPPL